MADVVLPAGLRLLEHCVCVCVATLAPPDLASGVSGDAARPLPRRSTALGPLRVKRLS